MTPQGPAMIQIIDFPSAGGLGPVLPSGYGGGGSRRPAGIHILTGILKRWWLVLLVTFATGGAVYFAAQRMILPVFEAEAVLEYTPPNIDNLPSDPTIPIHRGVDKLTDTQITLKAAQKEELRQALPWLKTMDLTTPAVKQDVVFRLKDIVDGMDDTNKGIVRISTQKPNAQLAAAICNAYAEALIDYVTETAQAQDNVQIKTLQQHCDEELVKLNKLQGDRINLALKSNIDTKGPERDAIVKLMTDLENKHAEALIKRITAQSSLEKWRKGPDVAVATGAKEKERMELLEAERSKDSILQAAMAEQVKAFSDLQTIRNSGMTEEHPEVKRAKERLEKSIQLVAGRDQEIRAIIDAKIDKLQRINDQIKVEILDEQVAEAEAFLKHYQEERGKLDKQLFELAKVQVVIKQLEDQIELAGTQYRDSWKTLQEVIRKQRPGFATALTLASPAFPPKAPSEDKRTKIQMAGWPGGLLLGVLLAMLVDKFDRRLRHPRDIEPLMNTQVLGMIPKIQELKRIKGEQARNLIAEEFRVIRTQILFGRPELQNKTILVTSPTPGDGKTSLAVNLAISIAKAGRRTLLVDADLRKPDVHRIFNIPDSPGLAELIHGTCEPGAAIRKSDIELLDVLPAGTPMVRPSELVSRPEMGQLLTALSELYDHIVFDTAPLLPVSDTHVLCGMVDGVICSFNAEVDKDTVKMVEEILRRCRANLVGTVMNQVRYKQSSSYHRGKTAYDSYYSSPRGATAPSKKVNLDPNVASLEKGNGHGD